MWLVLGAALAFFLLQKKQTGAGAASTNVPAPNPTVRYLGPPLKTGASSIDGTLGYVDPSQIYDPTVSFGGSPFNNEQILTLKPGTQGTATGAGSSPCGSASTNYGIPQYQNPNAPQPYVTPDSVNPTPGGYGKYYFGPAPTGFKG